MPPFFIVIPASPIVIPAKAGIFCKRTKTAPSVPSSPRRRGSQIVNCLIFSCPPGMGAGVAEGDGWGLKNSPLMWRGVAP
jgi:hypothetical protein